MGSTDHLRYLCDMCTQYTNVSEEGRRDMHEEYDRHPSDHNQVAQLKQSCKDRSAQDSSFTTFVFDLEEVLATLKLNAAIWYYKRKLCTYNLSWYEFGTKNATCNVWHECQAGRGSNEITSCVYSALRDAADRDIKTVSLFSDSAGGQNKMLWIATNRFSIEEIRTISHRRCLKGPQRLHHCTVGYSDENCEAHRAALQC